MKVIFLDRDGVINRYPGHKKYVTKIKDFHFLPGALEAVKNLTEADFNIFVISNQAGVSRGIFSQKKLGQITKSMLKRMRSRGASVRGVFYCTHKSEDNCSCRKPATGLVEKALKLLGIRKLNKKNSYFVGDSMLDMATGKKSGCQNILVLSGRESLRHKKNWDTRPDYIAKDLLEASKIILNENSNHPRLSRTGA